jgi:TRAP-type transport system small permease protein
VASRRRGDLAVPKILEKPKKVIDKIADIQQLMANGVLLLMMAIITFDVVGRNFFNNPLKGSYELTELSSAMLVFLALAITHRVGDHITIDFLVERFSEKARNLIQGVVELVIALVTLLMALQIYDNGLRMMERNATTAELALPVHPFLFLIALTVIIFTLTAILKAITHFRLAVNKQ